MSTSRGTFIKQFLAVASLSSVCVAGASAEDAHVKNIRLAIAVQSGQISVTSSDGARWDTVLTDMAIDARMEVDTRWPGYVKQVGLFLGNCNNSGCAGFPMIFGDVPLSRDFHRTVALKLTPEQLPDSNRDEILRECNQHLQPDGATKPYAYFRTLPASFSANTRKARLNVVMKNDIVESESVFNGGDHTAHDDFTVTVNCLATTHIETPPPRRDHIAVEDIKLFLTTYGGAAPAGRTPAASSCKPLKVTTRIETDKAGPVKVRLWRKIDNGPTSEEIRTLDAKALGADKFGADWDKWEHFGKTTYAQYMAEIIGGTFAPSTPWKDMTIHCGGNFADAPRPGDSPVAPDPKRPGFTPPPAGPKVSCAGGTLKGKDCVCPRGSKEVQVGANAFRCVHKTSGPVAPQVNQRKVVAPLPKRTFGAMVRPRVVR